MITSTKAGLFFLLLAGGVSVFQCGKETPLDPSKNVVAIKTYQPVGLTAARYDTLFAEPFMIDSLVLNGSVKTKIRVDTLFNHKGDSIPTLGLYAGLGMLATRLDTLNKADTLNDTLRFRKYSCRDTLWNVVDLSWSKPDTMGDNDTVGNDSLIKYFIYRGLSPTALVKYDSTSGKDTLNGTRVKVPPATTYRDINVVAELGFDFPLYYAVAVKKINGYEGKFANLVEVIVPRKQ